MRALASFAPIVACLVLSAVACSGSRSGLEGNVYRSDQVAFRVGNAPASWRPIKVESASLAYRDEPNRASVLVNARCGGKDENTPLRALVAHLVMGTTDRETASEEVIPFDGREALHTRYHAKLDGVPMDYDIYVAKKDGCVYDFVYVGEPRVMEAGVPAFEQYVASFHTLPGSGAP